MTKRLGRDNPGSFSRDRQMTFFDIMITIILKKGKTLELEIRDYFKLKGKKKVSKQAYSKQREKIKPEVFQQLNRQLVEKIEREVELENYYGYQLNAVDGTTIELPNSEELKEYYGVSKGRENSVGRVRARGLTIYDVLNEQIRESIIGPYNMSEKELIKILLPQIKEWPNKEKMILVMDRYYFGACFIAELQELGIKYVMRMKIRDYQEEKNKMKSHDEEVELKIRSNSIFYGDEEEKQLMKKKKKVTTRIVKVRKPEIHEDLATNLSQEEFSKKEIEEIYRLRWGIEGSYDFIKNKEQIENFSSKTVRGVEQEYYAGILLSNMLKDIKRVGNAEKREVEGKYEYAVNQNILVGIYKEEMIEIVLIKNEEERKMRYEQMIKEISSYLVPIKPGRKFPRRRMHSMNKYRSNLRRNS